MRWRIAVAQQQRLFLCYFSPSGAYLPRCISCSYSMYTLRPAEWIFDCTSALSSYNRHLCTGADLYRAEFSQPAADFHAAFPIVFPLF